MSRRLALAALAALALGACEEFDTSASSVAVDLQSPLAVGEHFVQLEASRDEIWVFTPKGGTSLDRSVVTLEDDVYSMQAMPDGNLLVLTSDEPALHVVDPVEPQAAVRIPLGAGYDAVSVSPDGRFVIAHFRPNSTGTDDSVLFTANQITVVDLGAEGAPTATEFTLTDATPLDFVFAPAFTLGDPDVEYHYAVAVAESAVSMVDLLTNDEANRQRVIPLTEPASGRTLVAQDILFSVDDPSDPYDMTMFVLASGSSEIFAIDLLPADPATGRVLQPAINQVSGGVRPVQMSAFRANGRDKLLVVDGGSAKLVVIDVQTSSAESITMDRQVGGALVWDQVESGDVRPKALLYRRGSDIVYFVELDNVERQGMGAMRAMSLGRPVDSVEVVETTGDLKAVARYTNGTGFGVLNLEQRRNIAIPARVQLAEFEIAGEWLFTITPSSSRLVAVDLANARPVEVEIVAPGMALEIAADTILVRHEDAFGWLTAYPLADFTAGAFDEAYGYAVEGLYDRNP